MAKKKPKTRQVWIRMRTGLNQKTGPFLAAPLVIVFIYLLINVK